MSPSEESMGYRSILVQVDDGRGATGRIAAAARIAAACEATLAGVFLRPSPSPHYLGVEGVIAPVIAAEAAFAEGHLASDESASAARSAFERLAEPYGIASNWLELADETGDDLIACARRHDLVVVPRNFRLGSGQGISAERIAMTCGGPVLIMPESGYPATFGRKTLVGWKESRESARVVRDAWPFLKRAGEVHFVTAAREGERRLDSLLQEHLRVHGCIAARLTLDRNSDRPAGEVILQHADMLGADLIVVGLYGHSRMQEAVLGGVSKYLLHNSSIPLLVSH
jgi:nucleotide-binding universal stress UspA family protein